VPTRTVTVLLLIFLEGCQQETPGAVGQLLSERVEIVVESNEPITAITVSEGDSVTPGTVLMTQDTARLDLQILEAEAAIARLDAVLLEQTNGPRQEVIATARVELGNAEIEQQFFALELERLRDLRERNLTSVESVDRMQRQYDVASGAIAIRRSLLDELLAGTRAEQLEQTRQQLRQASARLKSLELDKQRLKLIAPVAGVIDSLPFEIGERPSYGSVVAVLLTGEQPLARVYVPELLRAGIRPGDAVQIQVDGIATPLNGRVLRITSEASFTPYFALTERDRGRLSYVAEVSLPVLAARLPDGLPVEALFARAAGNANER
jgi:HlyD family secretion protein